ncbi:MAG: PTS sugar transporter subunit IIA [Phycisphaerae bacterium]|nr:PTS sugar transporter subunit IIA [Phycisphaerae bacterium]
MKISDFMIPDALIPGMQAKNRDDAIRELVQGLVDAGSVNADDLEDIVEKLVERERQGSTGIGKGIAVPHIKHASVTNIVGTIGCCPEGLDFNSLDKAPVFSVLLLLSPPNNPDQHLEAMEKLFSHLQRDMFRKFLRQAESRKEIIDLLKEADESPQESGL